MQQLEISRSDIKVTRIAKSPSNKLRLDEVRVKLDSFALTANNITYAVTGDRLGYWQFFPVDDHWGMVPVWGFAEVIESNSKVVDVGERLFGFFPMAAETTLVPARVSRRVVKEISMRRSKLHPFYNRYICVTNENDSTPERDSLRTLLYPLFATAYCLLDFLVRNEWFGAEQVIITSASSKTAIGLAGALAEHGATPQVLGLTSETRLGFALGLQVYDKVAVYDDIPALPRKKSVVVDIAGNQGVLSALLKCHGPEMTHCIHVGLTHWESDRLGLSLSAGQTTLFSVPAYLEECLTGPSGMVFQDSLDIFWRDMAARADAWLHIEKHTGLAAAEKIYGEVRRGTNSPATGHVIVL